LIPNQRLGIKGAALERLIDQFVVTTATGRDVTLFVYEEVARTSASREDNHLIVTEGWELVNEIAADIFQLRSGEIARRNSVAALS
jgi:hypothetical protein